MILGLRQQVPSDKTFDRRARAANPSGDIMYSKLLCASIACAVLFCPSRSFAGDAMPSEMEMGMLNLLVDGAHKCELRYPGMKPQAEALYQSLQAKYPRVSKSAWKRMQGGSALDLDPLPLTEAECTDLLNAKREGQGAEVTQVSPGSLFAPAEGAAQHK